MTDERELNQLDDQDQDQDRPMRSRAGIMGSVVALGLSHARLAITVVGRVPLVMLHSVQTVAKTGFSSTGERRQDAQSIDPNLESEFHARPQEFSTSNVSKEFRLNDLTRKLNRDMRPDNTTVRGAASDLMDTVARLHRDYAVVVSNFSEVITGAIENFAQDSNTDVSDERQTTKYQPTQIVKNQRKELSDD